MKNKNIINTKTVIGSLANTVGLQYVVVPSNYSLECKTSEIFIKTKTSRTHLGENNDSLYTVAPGDQYGCTTLGRIHDQ